jgi:ATP phosphoribosyltransferase
LLRASFDLVNAFHLPSEIANDFHVNRTEGRLNGSALNLLEGADIHFKREHRLDLALVKNLPIALVFLPAADIPTFVGEGRVDLGITGYDQVKEHDASVRAVYRQRRFSGEITPEQETASTKTTGCETVMDLGFGGCKLQVQVPENGPYASPKDLIGKNIGTSFVHLAEQYFADLELKHGGEEMNGSVLRGKTRTKIIELSGSVEAACALGVADGIVDLVGKSSCAPFCALMKIKGHANLSCIRVRRDNEGRRPQAHRHCR